LEGMFVSAGFHEVRVERMQREDAVASYDEYWAPIETGMMGSQPQIYVARDRSPRSARGGKFAAVTVPI